jgi:hypothetical protein
MNQHGAGNQIRRTSIAIADWLCGTLEGMACDNYDRILAKALDCWLRVQKKNSETLFIGAFICTSCKKPWNGFTLSEYKNSFLCPHSGVEQNIGPSVAKPVTNTPQKIEALRIIQQSTEDIVSKIETLNKLING